MKPFCPFLPRLHSGENNTVAREVTGKGPALIVKEVTGPASKKDNENVWYLAGLTGMAVFLVFFAVFIYKVVKRNQSKVKNLITLDRAETNMGPNSLYAIADEMEVSCFVTNLDHNLKLKYAGTNQSKFII